MKGHTSLSHDPEWRVSYVKAKMVHSSAWLQTCMAVVYLAEQGRPWKSCPWI